MHTSRRRLLPFVLLGIALVAAGGWLWFARGARQNVLLITLDTTRADRIGAYGYAAARTPVLDQLAKDGVLFERAFTPAPLTLPVHASLMTGLYPPEHGLRTNGYGSLPAERTTLAELLTEAGYDTAAFVASYVLDGKFGVNQGFAVYDDDLVGARPTQDAIHRFRDGKLVVDAALKWLGASRSRPFFCWVHLYDPHAPYEPHPDEFGDAFDKNLYDGEIAYTDQQVGRLVEFLKAHPDTLVVVVGDHGESLGDHNELQHGYTLYQSTQHVPLVVRGAAGLTPGTRVAAPAPLVDLLPTLTELLRVRTPAGITGKSLTAALRGQTSEPRPCYGGTDDPFLQNGWSPLRSLTTDRWKYIRTTKPELYDLTNDPRELKNLADADPDRLKAMDADLRKIEASMTLGEAGSIRLSDAERKALASLGYLGGKGVEPADEAVVLPDIKEMLPFNVETQAAIDLLDANKLDEAEAALRKIVERAPPAHVASRLNLGTALERLGRFDEAISFYEAALKERPEHTDALFHLGSLYAEQGKLNEAIKLFEKCQDIDPESAQPLFNLGLARAKLGDIERAERHLEDALEIDPAFPGVWSALGNIRARQGRVKDAESAYEFELTTNPTSMEAHFNLGALLVNQNRQKEARTHLAEAARLAPKNALARYNLGLCEAMLGDHDAAAKSISEAIGLQPDLKGARAALANVLIKLGRADDAIQTYRDELTRSPAQVEARVNLAALLVEKKRLDEAAELLTEAVRLAPDGAEARYNLALCLARQGERAKAAEQLTELLRRHPNHPRAAAELERLRAEQPEK